MLVATMKKSESYPLTCLQVKAPRKLLVTLHSDPKK